jgi:hypothetical protein
LSTYERKCQGNILYGQLEKINLNCVNLLSHGQMHHCQVTMLELVVDGVLAALKLTRGCQGEVEFCAVEGLILED